MSFHPVSLFAIAVILAALAVAWSRRFLAAGALAIANIVIFIATAFGPKYGSIPVIHAELALYSPNVTSDPGLAAIQIVSSMFVHADFGHIFGNMLVLLVFGLPFEERIGGRRFLVVYLLAGLAGTLAQVAVIWPGEILLMGASGAIFGIIGAFAASYPNTVVPVPVTAIILTFFVRMKVWIGAIVMGTIQLLTMAFLSNYGNTAYFAHLGGLAGGILLGWTLVKGKAPAHRSPVAVDLEALSPFARDSGTASALAQMKSNHDEPQIFQAWLDRFFRTASCPQCSHKVMPRHHGEIVCTQGHRFDVRRDRTKAIAA
ncbi:MAG: rhomboid family intramembrane serine protease [Candidatus Thermoplasmatota archaeon]